MAMQRGPVGQCRTLPVRRFGVCSLLITYGALLGFRGSYVPTLSKHRHACLTLLKNKGSQEERRTKVGLVRHRQLPIPGIPQEPDLFRQQEEA
jgi:hypothetical protein